MNEYPEDGRTIGTVAILQAIIAQMLREHPSRETILQSLSTLCDSMRSDANDTMTSGNVSKYLFLSEAASGAEDAFLGISEIVQGG